MSKPKQSKIIWFTGMSGAGKSFYAKYLNNFFVNKKLDTLLIDGDVMSTVVGSERISSSPNPLILACRLPGACHGRRARENLTLN